MKFIKNIKAHLKFQLCKTLIWLGLYKKKPENPWRCAECGSLEVRELSWVNPNTGKITAIGPCEERDRFCDYCDEHTLQVTESELLEDINLWWKQLDGDTSEIITGIEFDSFSSAHNPDKSYEKAIDKHWYALSTEQKISIWKHYNYDNRCEKEI